MKARVVALSLAAIAWAAAPAVAGGEGKSAEQCTEHRLTVGDPAPPLTIDSWVKGQPVTGYEKGRVYVVEFWATWCGPCVRSMPHLTEIQKKYTDRGVTVIGVTSVDKRNTPEKVKQMVADKKDVLDYTIAWDKDRATNESWMKAAKQNSIPCVFIVDQNARIAYIGYPEDMDQPLESIVAGKNDIASTKAAYEKRMETELKFDCFRESLKTGKYEDAYATAHELVSGPYKDDADMLNVIAWSIVDPAANVKTKDLGLALKAAHRADELTKGESAGILDTLARVHFEKGDIEKAIALQTKAVSLAKDEGMKKELEASLKEFQQKAANN